MRTPEFSFRTRRAALDRMQSEEFDLLIIGGGITGAAVARDATSRGLRVALVEKRDFAWGTSSRSSKLIHGGLRYLEHFQMGLVFEALAERSHLLKTAPHLVRPLPFYVPVYKGGPRGRFTLSVGLWLYDLLALLRTPGFHRSLSRKQLLKEIPFLSTQGLKGGLFYYDASMWDDQLVIDTLRNSQAGGAAVANYAEAMTPVWKDDRIVGFRVRDALSGTSDDFALRAKKVVVCAGPWLDAVGKKMSDTWSNWLSPSKGVHLVFDLKRIPISGALVMNHPTDRRVAFVMPRPDFGPGVTIVGTTDGPTPKNPEEADIDSADVSYLMALLSQYFPKLHLKKEDIISAYVGVRPLVGSAPNAGDMDSNSVRAKPTDALQNVSREHYIGLGPGDTVVVAGGKYTTHRQMAKEIVDFTLQQWQSDAKTGKGHAIPSHLKKSRTESPVNPEALQEEVDSCLDETKQKQQQIPQKLFERYGAEACDILEWHVKNGTPSRPDPDGFPWLQAQLKHAIHTEMVLHLEDFYLRRVPLFMARADHGLPWAEALSKVWAEVMGKGEAETRAEVERLKEEVDRRTAWEKKLCD